MQKEPFMEHPLFEEEQQLLGKAAIINAPLGSFISVKMTSGPCINQHYHKFSYSLFVLLKNRLSSLKKLICSSPRAFSPSSLFPNKLDG